MVIDIPIVSLVDIIGEDNVQALIEAHGSCRVYISKKKFEYQQEMKAYRHALSIGYTHNDALIYVAQQFDRSVRTIGRHFNMGMFE